MSDARATTPLVAQFRKGGVPKELRLLAAQGALPLKPEDLVELWTDLTRDPEDAVRETAVGSLTSFAPAEFLPILKSKETSVVVLTWAVTHRSERELREVVLQNVSLPDEIIEGLAGELPQELAELVVINQTRLLRRTTLLEVLETNPHLNNDQRRRLHELRETFKIGAAYEVTEAPPPPPPPPPPPEVVPEVEMSADTSLTEDEAMVRYLSDDERKETEKVSAVQKLYRLNTAEKTITALKGNREERAILIRDPNRIVAAAVLSSPKVTDGEIEAFAAMKNVSDQVLRTIGQDKEMTKKYNVIASLVKNPRTPIGMAMGFIPRLTSRDMKSVAVDKNVPEAIRKTAQKFIKGPEDKKPGGKH
ncbi:MAG TPA: hypothetical protein VMV21_15890 [Vicinamibacteria bacterium]|nr:hypothetical protein [Vicinamibacteria bacterium]